MTDILGTATLYAARLDRKAVAVTLGPEARALALAVEEAVKVRDAAIDRLERRLARLEWLTGARAADEA